MKRLKKEYDALSYECRERIQSAILRWLSGAAIVLVVTVTAAYYTGGFGLSILRNKLAGRSEYARAEYNRGIRVLEAKAAEEAAIHAARAEIVRAEGVAEANRIIGDSLRGNEAYLRYRWIEGLQTNESQVVYVPTEAGLPILESRRLEK